MYRQKYELIYFQKEECAFSPKTHSINLKLTRLLKQRVCKIVSMSKTHSISLH